MARPTLLTPEMQDRILAYLRISGTRSMAAKAVGIAEETLYRWTAKHPAFRQAVEEAEEEAKLSLLACLHQQARRGSTQAASWLLERRGGADFRPPKQEVVLDVTGLADDDLARLAAQESITEVGFSRAS